MVRKLLMRHASLKEAIDLWSKPERIVLVTCVDQEGKPVVITVSWQMRASFRPPMMAIAVHENRYIHTCIDSMKEFVLAVPGQDMAEAVLICGSPGDSRQDRFEAAHLKTKSAEFLRSPLIENCIANFECRVVNQLKTGDHTIFVGEVIASWVNETVTKNLLAVDDDEGYIVLAEQGAYKIGIVK
ncbi:hypothetical protein A2V82_11075 [candidate division KSB1 bacterium RBG_16_48_16]|nr:MAG: hypothetical protein A2V82_11075 [candidate division KSB1 bacterium RBG_16_48_16]